MLKGKLPIPKGSSVDVGNFSVKQVLNNNPLTKGHAKTMTREVVGNKLKDTIKDSMVNEAGKQGGFAD